MVAPIRASEQTRTKPATLSASMLDRLRAILEEERTERQAAVAPEDADGAERLLADALAARNAEVVADIDHALARIAAGTYGTCERCGVAIPFERLEAMPAARRCVACPQGPTGLLG